MSPPAPTSWLARRPLVADSAITVVATWIVLLGVDPDDVSGGREATATAYALAALSVVPVVLRRRYPVPVLVLCGFGACLYVLLGYKATALALGTMIALYTLARLRPLRPVAAVATSVVAPLLLCAWLGLPGLPLVSLVLGAAQASVLVFVGHLLRVRAEHLDELARRAERLARERELETERAVVSERMRIARELHDVVAHHLSVISVQSGLARHVFDSDPETARAGLAAVSSSARDSLEELRRLLGVLRTGIAEDPTTATSNAGPQPGLADLDPLLHRVRESGLTVDVEVRGVRRPLEPVTDRCAYRVAQEALTNVLKHAHASHVDVLLDYGGGEFSLEIQDDGIATASEPNHAGHGLVGMGERARMCGGAVEVGPGPNGYRVGLRLPLPDVELDLVLDEGRSA